METFEVFMRETRPDWFCKFNKDAEGAYNNPHTSLLYLAWSAGRYGATVDSFKLLMEPSITDWSLSTLDPSGYANNRAQRHFWCYSVAFKNAKGALPVAV